jgi:hypothetical protein
MEVDIDGLKSRLKEIFNACIERTDELDVEFEVSIS